MVPEERREEASPFCSGYFSNLYSLANRDASSGVRGIGTLGAMVFWMDRSYQRCSFSHALLVFWASTGLFLATSGLCRLLQYYA